MTDHPLTKWRKQRGMTAVELARELNTSAMSVHRSVTGSRPSKETMDRIVFLTNGEIDANDWLGSEARSFIAEKSAKA